MCVCESVCICVSTGRKVVLVQRTSLTVALVSLVLRDLRGRDRGEAGPVQGRRPLRRGEARGGQGLSAAPL